MPPADRSSRLRIVVLGYVVRGPIGGLAWHHLQYVMGLARLGHDVYYLEDSDDYPGCYDPGADYFHEDPTHGLRFAADAFARTGLGTRWAYHDAHHDRWHGPAADRMPSVCASADVVLNLSAMNPLRPWVMDIPVRVLVDTDPAFTQIRFLTSESARALADGHTAFFTFAENVGTRNCALPEDGRPWQPTRQPVVVDAWPVAPGPADGLFTTVMQWDSYLPVEHDGVVYGMKSTSFDHYVDLPHRVGPVFELALGSQGAPREYLSERGWLVRDPRPVTLTPWAYQRYIRASCAEFSVAKHGYVTTWSGWFSERSANYLASGRPVLTQDSGFSDWLPTGEGLLPFSHADEVPALVENVRGSYDRHCRAARSLAEAHFGSDAVLTSLLERSSRPAQHTGSDVEVGEGVKEQPVAAPERRL